MIIKLLDLFFELSLMLKNSIKKLNFLMQLYIKR